MVSSFCTWTESIVGNTRDYIHTAQHCAVLICTMRYITLDWIHTRYHILFITLIASEETGTTKYWHVSTNLNLFTGFIRLILIHLARTNQSFPILHFTSQYCSMLLYTACKYILVPCLLPTTTSALCSVSTFQYYSLLVSIVNIRISNVLNELCTAGFGTYSILSIIALPSLIDAGFPIVRPVRAEVSPG